MVVVREMKLIGVKTSHKFRRRFEAVARRVDRDQDLSRNRLRRIKSRGAKPCNLSVSSLTGAMLDTSEQLKIRNKRNLQCPTPPQTLIRVKY